MLEQNAVSFTLVPSLVCLFIVSAFARTHTHIRNCCCCMYITTLPNITIKRLTAAVGYLQMVYECISRIKMPLCDCQQILWIRNTQLSVMSANNVENWNKDHLRACIDHENVTTSNKHNDRAQIHVAVMQPACVPNILLQWRDRKRERARRKIRFRLPEWLRILK